MNIEVSKNTYQELSELKSDNETMELVIRRLLNQAKSGNSSTKTSEGKVERTPKKISSEPPDIPERVIKSGEDYGLRNLPDMRHSRVIAVFIDGNKISENKWIDIVGFMIGRWKEKGQDRAILDQLSSSLRMREEYYDDKGYKYNPKSGISVQGMSGNDSARTLLELASMLNISIEIVFRWTEKGRYPNQESRIKA